MARKLGRMIGVRMSEGTYQDVTRRARRAGMTLSSYVQDLVQRDIQEVDRFMLQSAARSSQATLNVVLEILLQTTKDRQRAHILSMNLSRHMDTFFGRQRAVPEALAREGRASTDGFIADIMAVYERHGISRTRPGNGPAQG